MITPAIPEQKPLFQHFSRAADALAWRKEKGCGGWIFVPDDASGATLFDISFTASGVMRHWAARGSGRLV